MSRIRGKDPDRQPALGGKAPRHRDEPVGDPPFLQMLLRGHDLVRAPEDENHLPGMRISQRNLRNHGAGNFIHYN